MSDQMKLRPKLRIAAISWECRQSNVMFRDYESIGAPVMRLAPTDLVTLKLAGHRELKSKRARHM